MSSTFFRVREEFSRDNYEVYCTNIKLPAPPAPAHARTHAHTHGHANAHGHARTHTDAWARMGTHGHAWARMGTHAHARAHGGPVANRSQVLFHDSIPSYTLTSSPLNLFSLTYGLAFNLFYCPDVVPGNTCGT